MPLCHIRPSLENGIKVSVNLGWKVFQYFKCGRKGNALDLWVQATGPAPYHAPVDLCNRVGMSLPTLAPRNREEKEPVAGVPTTHKMAKTTLGRPRCT